MSTDVRNTPDREWIEGLKAQLTEQYEAQRLQLTQLNADTGDPAEAHNQAALIAATRQSMEQIGEALRRIAEGEYGTCARCGGAIPRERLEILPHARFCVPCQQKQQS